MITSLGIGSGLDLQSLVNQLVAAERQPALQRFAIRESGLQAEFSAFGSLQAATQTLRDAIDGLKLLSPGKAATVSGAIDALTVSADDDAALGVYNITIDQLAAAHSLASSAFTATTDTIGSGEITINFGTTVYDPDTDIYTSFTANPERDPVVIEIDSGAQTVADVRDQINAADAGISAIIVSDVSGERLVISADATGADNSLEIQIQDDDGNNTDASGLSQLAFNSSATQLDQVNAAADADLAVNGLDVTSANNDGVTAISGLTLNLLSTTSDAAVVKVSERSSAVNGAVDDFINAYNGLVDLVSELAKFDPESGETGTLFGDSTLRGLVQALRTNLVTTQSSVPGEFSSLIELGVGSNDTNRLDLDSGTLNSALDDNFDGAVNLINQVGDSFLDTVDQYLAPDGLLQVRVDGLQTRLDDLSTQRAELDVRVSRLQERLTRRFANLDTLLSGLQQTSQFISNQLTLLGS